MNIPQYLKKHNLRPIDIARMAKVHPWTACKWAKGDRPSWRMANRLKGICKEFTLEDLGWNIYGERI